MTSQHYYFTGTVQGVGFRFTARQLAHEYGIDGWVKNLPDGRVECQVQGQTNAVEKFVAALRSHFGGYIRDVQAAEVPYDDRIDKFEVRYF